MGSVRFLGVSSSVEYRSLLKLNKRTMLGAMNAFCLTRMVVCVGGRRRRTSDCQSAEEFKGDTATQVSVCVR